MNIHDLNKAAWDHAVSEGTNPYTKVVSPKQVADARQGTWSLYLSGCKPVPKDWFPSLRGLKVLCLASGGGQQAPILAALGATVTLLDASPNQLAQDQFVAERDNLIIRLVEGDMADLSAFADDSADLSKRALLLQVFMKIADLKKMAILFGTLYPAIMWLEPRKWPSNIKNSCGCGVRSIVMFQ